MKPGSGSGDPGDLPGLQASRADPHAPRLAVHEDLGNLQVGQPSAFRARSPKFPGAAVRMSNILAVLGAFIADMASLSQSWFLLSAELGTSHLTTDGA